MSDLTSSSYAAVQPVNLEEQWIEYDTGLVSGPNCENAIPLALPVDATLPAESGCGFDLRRMGKRTLEWLQNAID